MLKLGPHPTWKRSTDALLRSVFIPWSVRKSPPGLGVRFARMSNGRTAGGLGRFHFSQDPLLSHLSELLAFVQL